MNRLAKAWGHFFVFDWLKRSGTPEVAAFSAAPAYSELDQAITSYLAATQKTLTRFDDVPHEKVAYQVEGVQAHAQQILLLCQTNDKSLLDFAIGRLASGLTIPDPFQASRAAMLIGILVEKGGSPTLALPAVLGRAPELLSRARELFDIMQAENAGIDDFYDDNPALLARYFNALPDGVKSVRGLPLLLRPAMTMLCRDVPARIVARQNAELLRTAADMEEIQSESFYLHHVLQMTDDAPFLILHAHQKKGFRVRVTGVRNNFHLFTLVQGELIGPGKLSGTPPNAEVVAVAKGEAQLTHNLHDNAVFGYFHYLGLRPDATLDTAPGASWLWGEMPAHTTPRFEGAHVILLDTLPLNSRSWDSGFFAPLHDALQSFVTIDETLSPSGVDALMARLSRAAQTPANDGG